MDRYSRSLFLALIAAQAAHSVEEYVFRLYDVLAPARYVSGLIGIDRAIGFVVVNATLVAVGLACWVLIRAQHRWGPGLAWFWVLLETANGLAHIGLAAVAGGYFPGIATAPLLLAVASWLAYRLAADHPNASAVSPD